MARELRASYTTGATMTAKVYLASAATLVGTVTMTEAPSSSMYYAGTFPASAEGVYDVLYLVGGACIGSETVFWNGTSVVTLNTVNSGLTSARVTPRSPLMANGEFLQLVRGRDYNATVAEYPEWTITHSATLTGGTLTLSLREKEADGSVDEATALALSVSGTLISEEGTTKVIRAYLTAAQTGTLTMGERNHRFYLDAQITGGIIQLVRGDVTVLEEGV